MSLVKVCKACGCQNDLSNSLCDNCLADISGISPIDPEAQVMESSAPPEENKPLVEDSSATVIEKRRSLRFEASDGSGGFNAGSGVIIGREGEGKSYLSSHMTVSRRHARLTYDGEWKIEDIGSANGTWVNERKLETGELCPVKTGDRVALSHSCVFNIKG